MPLTLSFLPSFERSLKNLDTEQKEIIRILLKALTAYYDSHSNLHEAQKNAPGFFYKQLRKPFYEAGVERKLRLVIRREGETCAAMMAGNHDQVRRFLANQ